MSDGPAADVPRLERAEVFPHALPQRLRRLEPPSAPGRRTRGAVIDRHEDIHAALAGGDGGVHAGAPHEVVCLGVDCAVAGRQTVGAAAKALMRLAAVLDRVGEAWPALALGI